MARLCTHTESGHYLMALDAGTGSVRAVIFDLQGKQIAVGQAEWQHLAVPDVPGSMEFDLAKNWQTGLPVYPSGTTESRHPCNGYRCRIGLLDA